LIAIMRKTATVAKTKSKTIALRSRKNSKAVPARRTKTTGVHPNWESPNDLLRNIPLTTEDRIAHIQALGQRVTSYVKYMCAVSSITGSSAEAKERAVEVFYQRLAALEQELGRIHDGLLLG
jgi:hypothetical protein